MEVTESTLYWILKLDDIRQALGSIALFGIVLGGMLKIVELACKADGDNFPCLLAKACNVGIIIGLIAYPFYVFTPTTNQYAMMKVGPHVLNSDFVREDMPKEAQEVYGLAKEYVKAQLTEKEEPSE